MYRSRLAIWITSVCIIICLVLGVKFVKWIGAEPLTYDMYCVTSDNILKTNISDMNGDYRFHLLDSNEEADIIIQPTSTNNFEGYTKYSDYIYTPMVLWARSDCTDSANGFNVLNENYSNSTVYKDLMIILDAIENNKTFEEIGINKKVAQEAVKLYIPNKMSVYYPHVKELFYITLNGGIVPSDLDREQLKSRVDMLLEKCVEVEDVGQKILSLYDKDDKTYNLFIGPECLVSRDSYAFNTTNDNAWMSVYLNYTCTYSYDLFVKTENKDEILKSITESKFSKVTGYRVHNTSNFSGSYSHTIDNVTVAK